MKKFVEVTATVVFEKVEFNSDSGMDSIIKRTRDFVDLRLANDAAVKDIQYSHKVTYEQPPLEWFETATSLPPIGLRVINHEGENVYLSEHGVWRFWEESKPIAIPSHWAHLPKYKQED